MTVRSRPGAPAAVPPCQLGEVVGQLTALGVDVETIAGRFAQAHDLHPTDVRALRVLADATSDLSAGELAERLALTSGATTRMIDRLERAGHLVRVRGTGDRRVVHVQMTARAWTAAEAFFGQLGPVVDQVLGGQFTPDELATVSRFLVTAGAAIRAAAATVAGNPPR